MGLRESGCVGDGVCGAWAEVIKQISWLPPGTSDESFSCGDMLYLLDDLRSQFDVRDLPHGGQLVLKRKDGSNWLEFAVMMFARSNTDGSNTLVSCVFHGDGPGGKGGSLRECRHTYWGEDGYIFYPDGALISSAFAMLSEFFDDMVAKS